MRRRRKNWWLRLIVLGPVVTLLAACGSSGTTGGTASAGDSGTSGTALLTSTAQNRQDLLVAAAKKEGSLTWATTLAGPIVTAIISGFEKQYPFVKVTVNRSDQATALSQILQAHAAGKASSDVLEVTSTSTLVFEDANVLLPFVSPSAAGMPKKYQVLNSSGQVIALADRISYIGLGYNTSLVKTTPKTLNDLLSPAFAHQMVTETNTTGTTWIGGILHELGESQGEAYLKKLSAQHIALSALSGASVMGLVATKQYGASPTVYHNHEQQEAQKGESVAWVPVQPVIANVGELEVLAGTPHPASAMLFIDYVLSSAGQQVFKDNLYNSPEEEQPFASWDPVTGAKTADEFNEQVNQWTALQKKYFG